MFNKILIDVGAPSISIRSFGNTCFLWPKTAKTFLVLQSFPYVSASADPRGRQTKTSASLCHHGLSTPMPVRALSSIAYINVITIINNNNSNNSNNNNNRDVFLSQTMTSSSESAEPAGWLRLGDLAIGDSGVCVTSLIKDKIREYMLNEEQQQQQHTTCTGASTAAAAATAVTAVTITKTAGQKHAAAATASRAIGDGAGDDVGGDGDGVATGGGSGTCVRRIGNSLDLLLCQSRNAGHAVAAAAAKHRSPSAPAAVVADDCAVSTTIGADADSSRPTADGHDLLPPPPPTFTSKR